MTSPASPAETRAFIVERLTGATGVPDRVLAAGRALAGRIATALADPLNALLSSPIEVEAGEVALGRLGEALSRPINEPVLPVPVTGQAEPIVLAANTATMSLLINGLFGADPATPVAGFERPLSSLEVDAAALVFKAVVETFNESAEKPIRLGLPLGPIATGAERAKLTLRDGPAVSIPLLLKAPGGTGTVTITLAERMLSKPSPAPDTESGGEWSERIGEEIRRSAIALEATVPMGSITLGEIARWKPGMLIDLPEDARAQTRLSARDRTLFVCEFGRLGQNYTVRISKSFDAGQDLIDGLLANR